MPSILLAQKKTRIEILNADEASSEVIGGQEVRTLKNNVRLQQGSVFMSCDSAYSYPASNTVNAFGHVHITQNDTLHLYGDKLEYDGDRKYAVVTGNVRMSEKTMTLTTDKLDYDMEKKTAFYTNGGVINDGKNRLTSRKGYYNSEKHSMFFKNKVEMVNSDFTLKADTLEYSINSRRTFFHGPTTIKSKDEFLYCETGWYNTLTGTARFGKNAYIANNGQMLYGDSLYFDNKKGYSKADGNVKIVDTVEHLIIEGAHAESYENPKKNYISGHILVTRIMNDDSLYLTADTITTIYNEEGEYEKILGYPNALIYNKEFQARCDSLVYSFIDSTIQLNIDPIFWINDYQATAERMVIHTRNSQIDLAELFTKSFMCSPEDSSHFNQIKGRDMTAFFNKNVLSRIEVNGNGQSVYYVKDDKNRMAGVNSILGSDIFITVKNQKISRIKFTKNPEATLWPPSKINPNDERLPGLNWRIDEKPEGVEDLRR